MLNKTGIPTSDLVNSVAPSIERIKKGPVAMAECFQCIPCNPCYTSCPRGAIKPLIDINERPKINHEQCNGCGICIANCPGLAIFVIDGSYSDDKATIKIPYELLPLPQACTQVTATDRSGKPLCKAKVLRVVNTPSQDKTAIVWLEVPYEFIMQARFFITDDSNISSKEECCSQIIDNTADETVVCRCENVTLGQIRDYIKSGHTTVDEIKRLTRAGMGPCSGRTCRLIIQRELEQIAKIKIEDQIIPTHRPPTTPIRVELIAKAEDENE
jgi:Fe-S-cluster-containing hydrogenase component 2